MHPSGAIKKDIKENILKEPLPTSITVADFIAQRLAASDKTQRQIAEECGFDNPNVLSMLKSAATKVPLNRVGALAEALNVDPAHLFRLVMSEYLPDTWQALESILGGALMTANELDLVRGFRAVTGGTDPQIVSLQHTSIKVMTVATICTSP